MAQNSIFKNPSFIISRNEEEDEEIINNIFDETVEKLNTELNPHERLQSISHIRKLMLLLLPGKMLDKIIDPNILSIIINCLKNDDDPDLQCEAAWILTNISSGSDIHTQAVVELNAIELLVRLLRSPHVEVQAQSLWTLSNIMAENIVNIDTCIILGIVDIMVNFFNTGDVHLLLLNQISFAIMTLFRFKKLDDDMLIQLLRIIKLYPFLEKNINWSINSQQQIQRDEITQNTVWALYYLVSSSGHNTLKMVFDADLVSDIIKLLDYNVLDIVKIAIKTINNISTGDDEQTQAVLNNDALQYCHSLLNHNNEKITKYTIHFLSNILAGNDIQAQSIIDSNLFPLIINQVSAERWETTLLEISLFLNEFSERSRNHVVYLAKQKVIAPLCFLLKQRNMSIISYSLNVLNNILNIGHTLSLFFCVNKDVIVCSIVDEIELCEGLQQRIQELERHSAENIRELVSNILCIMNKIKEDFIIRLIKSK